MKIRAAQQNTTNKVWPISGWAIKSKEIIDIKIIDIKYLNKIFDLISHKIVAKIITKNGFRTSMGWNLGKKNIIFFSPAGASFDSFKNFEDRGYYFNKIIKKYINAKR